MFLRMVTVLLLTVSLFGVDKVSKKKAKIPPGIVRHFAPTAVDEMPVFKGKCPPTRHRSYLQLVSVAEQDGTLVVANLEELDPDFREPVSRSLQGVSLQKLGYIPRRVAIEFKCR